MQWHEIYLTESSGKSCALFRSADRFLVALCLTVDVDCLQPLPGNQILMDRSK